ncbi:phage tail protein [Yokenella regensburgei]|uniref:phage tail protein n=1 Tax=Yokenella regensburgei TaxID=158877 RepID=UPI003F18DE69
MADNSLNTPIKISAIGLSAASLPSGLSPAYQMYILNQSLDFTNVAGKANEAGQGAYDAQVRNDEQDVVLDDHEQRLDTAEATLQNHETRISAAEETLVDHESRIAANEAELANHEIRITQNESDIASQGSRLTTAEGNITTLQSDVSSLTTRIGTAESNITALHGDYVSKSATSVQSLASPLNVTTSYSVGGTKVIGARATGWTAATGTALLGAFNASQAYTVSAAYTQAEVTTIANGLIQARQRIKALEDMLRTHGLMN